MAKIHPLLKAASVIALVPVALTGLSGCASEEPSAPKKERKKDNGDGGGGGGLPFGFGDGGGGGGDTPPTSDSPYGGGGGSTTSPGGTGGSGGSGGGDDVVRFGTHDLSNINWTITCITGDSAMVSGNDGSYDIEAPSFYVLFDKDKPSSISISSGGPITKSDSLYWSSSDGQATVSFDGKTLTASGKGLVNFADTVDFELKATCDSTI